MLFELVDWYNLKTIEETTKKDIRKKFPKPVDEEDLDEYNDFVDDEYKLELAERLKRMAELLEKQVDEKVKKNGYV